MLFLYLSLGMAVLCIGFVIYPEQLSDLYHDDWFIFGLACIGVITCWPLIPIIHLRG